MSQRFLQFFLAAFFLVASVANGSHALDFCADGCEEMVSMDTHLNIDSGHHVMPSETEKKTDGDCSDHQHHCCHHQNLLNHQNRVSLLESEEAKLSLMPQQMISDPHGRIPYQPPRA